MGTTHVHNWFQAKLEALLRDNLIKIGAKVIRLSRYAIFQMAEVMVSKRLF
jgi:hypothetical protein